MTCHPSPFPLAVLDEATRISPHRRGAPGWGESSDGICGDATHQQEVSDHDPDARGIPHAVDISQSTPGSPFWEAGLGVFDAHGYGWEIAQRIVAGTEDRVKYLVSFNGQVDVIFDPAVSLTWRQNGAPKQDHRSHLHVSFLATPDVENSTAPFFEPHPPEADMPLNNNDLAAIRNIVQQEIDEAIGGPDPHKTGQWTGRLGATIKHYTDPLAAAIARLKP